MTRTTTKTPAPETVARGRKRNSAATERPLSELERKLLSLGGEGVDRRAGDDCHAAQLLARGQVFDLPVKMKRGEPHRCHANAAGLWCRDVEKVGLVTGYGLSGGFWTQHSWAVVGGVIYETTVRFERYFGVLLDADEATSFWYANYLVERYPGPLALMRDAVRKASPAAA